MDARFSRRHAALAALALPSLAGCATIPVLPDGPEDPLERQALLLEVLDGAPLTAGNSVRAMSGGETVAEVFRLIAAARQHVHLEFYILQDLPGASGSLFQLLAAKLAQGVAVNIIADAYGSLDTRFAPLTEAGAKLVLFNPLSPLAAPQGWRPNDRDHRKLLVVDGRVGITGGVNLDRVYLNPCTLPGGGGDPEQACWRDGALRLEGPAVASLQRLFLDTWQRQHGPELSERGWFPTLPPRGPARVRVLGSAPGERQPRYYVTLLSAIEAARDSLWLATGYFVPTLQQRHALRRAARRGVKLHLLLPGQSDAELALAAQRATYEDLLEVGCEIREVTGAILHAKLAVVDGVWSAVGSSNLDRRSVAWNNEVDAIVLGRETAAAVQRLLAGPWRQARPVSLAEVRSRGLGAQLRELGSRVMIDLL